MIRSIRSWLKRTALAVMLVLPLAAAAQPADPPLSREKLDQMLAQVALYPDSLLSQVLMAATYPEDFAKAAAWSKAHPDAKGDSAVKQVEGESWDPSVASLVAFPEALITLAEKPDYVRDLGDAFLEQPEDVMDSVQRLRTAAQKAGNLSSNEQIKVSSQAAPAPSTTTVVVQQAAPPPQIIVIEPAQPQVIYVPAYNPAIVYGSWWYPSYPPYYFPPPPGYWFSRTVASGIAFGIGIGISNSLWGGFDWGRRDVNINVNHYNNININRKIDVNSQRANWKHDPGHRGKTPYRGGDATRQKLEKQRDVASREAYRGKEGGRDLGRDTRREASREKAALAMKDRGGAAALPTRDAGGQRDNKRPKPEATDRDKARDKAESFNRDKARDKSESFNRDKARDKSESFNRDKAESLDRGAARQKAQAADRDAARQRAQMASKDNALKGVNDRNSTRQVNRGTASKQAAAKRPAAPNVGRPAPPRAPMAKPARAPNRATAPRAGARGR